MMGRTPTSMAINPHALRGLLESLGELSERAQKFGVTKQALNGWLKTGFMPPRAIAELINELGLSPEVVNRLLEVGERESKTKRRRWKITVYVDEPESERP